MPRDFQRGRRLEEQILRLLAELVRREVKDPRVGLVTFTTVELSRDLSHAKVYFVPFDGRRTADEVGAALASAAGFLRNHLKKQLEIRHVPELRFVVDHTIDEAARLSALINRAVASDAERSREHEDGEAGAVSTDPAPPADAE
jgi:ribosome-binding factor A